MFRRATTGLNKTQRKKRRLGLEAEVAKAPDVSGGNGKGTAKEVATASSVNEPFVEEKTTAGTGEAVDAIPGRKHDEESQMMTSDVEKRLAASTLGGSLELHGWKSAWIFAR